MYLFNNKPFRLFDPDGKAGGAPIDETPKEEVIAPEPAVTPEQDQFPDMSKINSVEDVDKFLGDIGDLGDETVLEDENKAEPEPKEPNSEESTDINKKVKDGDTPNPESPVKPEQENNGNNLVLSDEVLTKIVNEKFADKTPEEREKIQKKLESFKGKTFEDVVSALGYSQAHIDKLTALKSKEHKEQFFKPTEKEKNLPVPESSEYREKLILDRVKDNLPKGVDTPPNLDTESPEFMEWYRDFNDYNPIKSRKFLDSIEAESKNIDEAIKQADYVEKHHTEIIANQQNQAVESVNSYFKDKLKIDLKDYGFDFTPDKEGDLAIMDKLIFDQEDGKPDPDLVEYVFGRTPVLKPAAVASKFVRLYLPEITAKREEKIIADARKQAYDAKNTNKELAPSLGPTPTQKKEMTVSDFSQAQTPEEVTAMLKKLP